ncbi:hypothetical protein BKA65DRAFT_482767 [Rhexocercosporidium sp. MPI-PUGE-AT-0058]|nr:hypothetical protein BKA65DRAFT_482767 [Rhexocercosporidium sp. MPI-PUGE-AT-0058]
MGLLWIVWHLLVVLTGCLSHGGRTMALVLEMKMEMAMREWMWMCRSDAVLRTGTRTRTRTWMHGDAMRGETRRDEMMGEMGVECRAEQRRLKASSAIWLKLRHDGGEFCCLGDDRAGRVDVGNHTVNGGEIRLDPERGLAG